VRIAEKGTEKIHGTDRDLRKLTAADAIRMCIAYGMSPKDAASLERWDRVAAIRQFTTTAVIAGVMSDDKFARSGGAASTNNASKEAGNFHEMAQVIWSFPRRY